MSSGLCVTSTTAAALLSPSTCDTVSHTLLSEQGKGTVEMSDGSGCVHSATPHRACGALLSVFLLVIPDGWKLLQKLKGAATTTPSSYFGNTLSGTQLQVEIFPLESDTLWGASLRNCDCYRQYFMHQKSSHWRMLHRGLAVVLLTQRVTPGLLTELL